MVMKTASIALLKQNLSSYLRMVEQGSEVTVTSHKRPVARLVPNFDDKLAIRAATLPVSRLSNINRVDAKDLCAVSILIEDRRHR